MQLEFVPSAVVERASVHDMPRDGSVVRTPAETVECASCGVRLHTTAVQHKYRLKLQVAYGTSIDNAILFDEVAQELIGATATQLRKLELEHPSLLWLIEDLLVGLHVSFSYQRREDRAAVSPAAAADPTKPKFTKDLKIVAIAPLAKVLLPKSLVALALDALAPSTQAMDDTINY